MVMCGLKCCRWECLRVMGVSAGGSNEPAC